MEKIRVRFAPSPTGYIHVGNARTALFNWLFARKNRGVFILRIEDTDIERSAETYEKKLIEDLRWLGIEWDEGPDTGGARGPYRQSERGDLYQEQAQKLMNGGKAYYCFCSPDELERERRDAVASGRPAVYSGKCRGLAPEDARKKVETGNPAAVRLRTPGRGMLTYNDLIRGPLSFDLALTGDPVLIRSNGMPAYNFAVVVDDTLMGITHVIRGEDHISNTPRQILTYEALSFPLPSFAHLSMVMGPDNTRLSKRHGATAVDQFRQDGILSSALFNYLALLGWAPPDGEEVLDAGRLIELFRLEKVSRSAAIFDYDKLNWLNRQHMKTIPSKEAARAAYPFLKEEGLMPENMTEERWEWLERAVGVLIERINRFSEIPAEFELFSKFSPSEMDHADREDLKMESSRKVLRLFIEKTSEDEKLDFDRFSALTQEIKQESGIKGKDLYHPLRLALTGCSSGLDLDKFIPLVEEGASLHLPKSIKSCRQRIFETLNNLE
ncbi:MAG: glutamate--tRNA ligase [Candidatus Aminicenantes bacterium]|nr:glutamate--tRNA ligase [Candidatus Aminicenantes bacterium]